MFPAPNYTQIPNIFLDDIAKTLKEGELRVLFVIMRQTFGWHKAWDRISLSQLMKKTGMERKAVHNSLKTLIGKKLVIKRKEEKPGEQNCWYSLIVQSCEKEEILPDSESDFPDDSNNSYQYPKDTPPSILKIPTKETLPKEKNNNVEANSKENVVVFSKESLEEAAQRNGLGIDQASQAWKKWNLLSKTQQSKIPNPFGWCIDCIKKNYDIKQSLEQKNYEYLCSVCVRLQELKKDNLIQSHTGGGYLIFIDSPRNIYHLKDSDFIEKVKHQLKLRGIKIDG